MGGEETKKIRTLDIKVHFAKEATPETSTVSTDESVIHHVELIEKLRYWFAVVGSSLEGSMQAQKAALEKRLHPKIKEPVIHTPGGLPMEEFSISYMNHYLHES